MAVNDICIVPTHKRDELLFLCLEAVRAQDSKLPIIVFSDRGHHSQDLSYSCAKFGAELVVRPHGLGYGNSFNVIEGMRYAVSLGVEMVHCIEDDTILHRGYLDWARPMLREGGKEFRFACALGRIPDDRLSTWYTSPCVSWNSRALMQCLEKVPLGYFAPTREEMQKIVDAAFPGSRFHFGSAEQDGFFLRCLEFFRWRTAYPEHCLASHIGAWGYNRHGHNPPAGTFEERVHFCRKLLHDREKRTEMFGKRITDSEMEGLAR